MKKIERLANFFAKNSLKENNDSRFARFLCRKAYQSLPTCWSLALPDSSRLIRLSRSGDLVDTYPWPYREPWFLADVPDESGFPVRHDTSYCAWKMSEEIGVTLHCPKDMTNIDASHWRHLLRMNGFLCFLDRPQPGRPHIGVSDRLAGPPEVVWYEGYDSGLGSIDRENDTDGYVIFTTYRDGKYFIGATPADRYTWVQIGRKMTLPVL